MAACAIVPVHGRGVDGARHVGSSDRGGHVAGSLAPDSDATGHASRPSAVVQAYTCASGEATSVWVERWSVAVPSGGNNNQHAGPAPARRPDDPAGGGEASRRVVRLRRAAVRASPSGRRALPLRTAAAPEPKSPHHDASDEQALDGRTRRAVGRHGASWERGRWGRHGGGASPWRSQVRPCHRDEDATSQDDSPTCLGHRVRTCAAPWRANTIDNVTSQRSR